MRWLPVIPVLLGLLLTTTAHGSNASNNPLLAQLNRCINKQFTPGQATERTTTINIKTKCPGLYQLRNQPLIAQLQPPLRKETTVNQLLDIRALIIADTGPNTRAKSTESVDLNQLPALLKQYYIPPEHKPEEPDLWDKVKDWLREMLIKQHEQSPEWLKNYLNSLDPSTDTWGMILKFSIVILILSVLIIVFNELRAANIFAALRHRRGHQKSITDQTGAVSNKPDSEQPIDQLADKEFVGQILCKTLTFLMHHKILPEKFSYTNYEFLQHAQLRDETFLGSLRELFSNTDIVLYGDRGYSMEQRRELQQLVEQIMQQGRLST